MEFYRSPLHIIPEEVIANLSVAHLKQARKEVLLEFELAGATTINIKGKVYDKSAVLHAFELLEQDFNYHLLLYKDKALLRFIEDGDMSLFYEKRTWEDLGSADFRQWLGTIFQYRLQKIIHKCVQVKGYHSIRKLRAIHLAKLQLPNTLTFLAFAKAHQELSFVVLETEKILASPFQKNKGLRLKKNIADFINHHYLSVFKWLPFDFERLKQKYVIAAHNFLASVFGKNRYFKSYKLEELKLLKIAAEISATFRPELKAGSLVPQLQAEIDGRISNNINWGDDTKLRPIAVIVGIIMFWLVVSNLLDLPSTSRTMPKSSAQKHLYQKAEVIKANITGTCWMSQSATNEQQVHFFAFHNDSIGEYAIFIPLGSPSDYASLSLPFSWEISGIEQKKNLTLSYSDIPTIQVGGSKKLNAEHQQLLNKIQGKLTSSSQETPIYYQFPEDIIFYDDFFGIANSLRFKKMKDAAWNAFVDVPIGDHSFIDKQIEAISAQNYLKSCKAPKSKRTDFQLFINPEDLSANYKRGVGRSSIGKTIKKNGQWVLSPYKWSVDEKELPIFYIDYKNIRYIDQNNQLKRGDIRVYIKSFATDTCQVVAL